MNFIITIILGILPSFVWLLFFLRHDAHPEPKSMILKVFFAGALVAPAAAIAGTGFQEILLVLNLSSTSALFLLSHIFLGVAVIEEILKYIVVRFLVLSHHAFDEPVDAMLYMIISGLGFAALENILIFLSQTLLGQNFGDVLSLLIYRFLTATFLHALCSAIIGYFLALSICNIKNQFRLISAGLCWGVLLHGFYDLAVIKIDHSLIEVGGKVLVLDQKIFVISIISLLAILIGLAIFVIKGIRELKKMQSVCLSNFVLTKSKRAGKI
jgi:RsiW-degrading membrane proteinase PrsW (M82 family)